MNYQMLATTLAALVVVADVGLPTATRAADAQTLRAADAATSCPALAAEVDEAPSAKSPGRAISGGRLLGLAITALQVAGPSLGGGRLGAGAGVVQQAAAALQSQAMQGQTAGADHGAARHDTVSAEAPHDPRYARLRDLQVPTGC